MSDPLPAVTISRDTLEAVHDLRVVHCLDATQALLDRISLELQQDLDEHIIADINFILDSEPTEDITIVGDNRQLWLSEEELADIRAWGGIDVPLEPKLVEKVNWRKEGF